MRCEIQASGLRVATGDEPRCPRPLKIVAAEMSGDIDDFANEIEASLAFTFHCLR